MHSQEKREYPRFESCKVPVNLSSSSTQSKEGRLTNISRTGAYLKGCWVSGAEAKVIFHPYRGIKIERECRIARTDEQRHAWSAIEFTNPLTPIEVDRLENMVCPGTSATYESAKRDHEIVCQELRDIKSCRSNIFVWTVWILATATLGILTLTIENKLNDPSVLIGNFFTLFVIAIMLGIFILGVLTTIEKAIAINLREGFLAALDFYLRKNHGPKEYKGWTHLKNCLAECTSRHRTQMCPRRTEANTSFARCGDEGEDKAAKLNSGKCILPTPIDSFTSLTSYVHTALFGALVFLFCLSLMANFSSVVWRLWTCLLFVGGFVSSVVISKRFTRIYKITIVWIVIGVASSMLACAIDTSVVWRLGLTFGLGVLLGSLAWYLVQQLHHARVGQFSFETYTHTWFAILEHCISIPDDWQQTQYYTGATLDRQILNWLLDYDSPGRVPD